MIRNRGGKQRRIRRCDNRCKKIEGKGDERRRDEAKRACSSKAGEKWGITLRAFKRRIIKKGQSSEPSYNILKR